VFFATVSGQPNVLIICARRLGPKQECVILLSKGLISAPQIISGKCIHFSRNVLNMVILMFVK